MYRVTKRLGQVMVHKELTGNFRIRKTFFGWDIKVECLMSVYDVLFDLSPPKRIWVNATVEDLIDLGINCS